MSPIPLGILAASGVEVAVAKSFDLLRTNVLESDTTNILFSNLDTAYSTDYQHLQIRGFYRGSRGAAEDDLRIQLNGDTSASYAQHRLIPQGSQGNGSASYMVFNGMTIGNSQNPSLSYSSFVMDILDPFETSKNTTIKIFGGYMGDIVNRFMFGSGLYTQTDALSSINLYNGFGNFLSTGRFSLYGLKAGA